MIRVLFIQLYRYSDLLQATPAIAAVRQARPDSHISVLVRKPFGDVLEGNADIDDIIEWDTDALSDDWGQSSLHFTMNKNALKGFVTELRGRNFDTVYNLSCDTPGALLTYLIDPPNASGLVFHRDRQYRVRNEWMQYLLLAAEVRHLNSLNMADILVEACETGEEPVPKVAIRPDDEQWAEDILRQHYPLDARPVALQPGAGKAFKRWSPENFTQMAASLQRKGRHLMFLGTDDERDDIAHILDRLPGGTSAVSMAGQTPFPRLAALLKRCDCLVANDTATVHVAAATATPCLLITHGPVWGYETGPYGDGHYILQPVSACHPCAPDRSCEGMPCREEISVEAALASIDVMTSGDGRIPQALQNDNLVLNRTTWMPDGMLGLEPLNRPALSLRELVRMMFRAHTLAHGPRVRRAVPTPSWRPWIDEVFTWYRIDNPATLARQASLARRDFSMLERMADDGRRSARAIAKTPGPLDEAALGRMTRAMASTRDVILQRESNDILCFLIAKFRHALRDMVTESDLATAVELRLHYRALADGCLFMSQALEEFIEALEQRVGRAAITQESYAAVPHSAAAEGLASN